MKILKEKCIGCGTCVMNYPGYFKIIDNKAHVLKDTKNKKILKVCPLNAIK